MVTLEGKMEYYVLRQDYKNGGIASYNLFEDKDFRNRLLKIIENYVTYEEYKRDLKRLLQEKFLIGSANVIRVGELGSKVTRNATVYEQVEPNFDILARYIIETWNETPNRKNLKEM